MHTCRRYALEGPRMRLGRLRCRPDHVVAVKACSSRGFCAYLRQCGIGRTIPEKSDQGQHRRNRVCCGGRPPGFDRAIYRCRNTVERCFNSLKNHRGVVTMYGKTAAPTKRR
ncbi:hypothetical protein GCM10018784_79720 [Streptomyces hydrogenans]|nr:hypothetical protein GCM10018784_79720 [Streptomyces hydrogenans]